VTIFRDPTPGRVRGRRLQTMRAQAFASNPLCHGPDSECEKVGRVRQWSTRDHIIPLFKGGKDEASNLQYLCEECDYSKTNRDLGRRDKLAIGVDGWPITP
jgi:5-methylcytosine-specific restriction endonuclease McrA